MDTNSNILRPDLNIDTYLNLGHNLNHNPSPPVPNDSDSEQDQFYTSRLQSQILPSGISKRSKPRSSTLGSEYSESLLKKTGRQATAKYRQRRKKYVQELQQQVRQLQGQISGVETTIKDVKDSILVKLQTSIKTMQSTQNSQIYTQLQTCLNRSECDEQLVDIDKVNLLLNTLKYRIGPSGRERQAKIAYNFNNIVNTLFPGLHRYFLVTATHDQDIFRKHDESHLSWTRELIQKINLTEEQVLKIKQQQSKLTGMYEDTINKINVLHTVKRKMKQQALLVDSAEDEFREYMTPIQCAHWIVFCEKYKYTKDIALDGKFRPKGSGNKIEDEMEKLLQFKLGRKKVHRDPELSEGSKYINF